MHIPTTLEQARSTLAIMLGVAATGGSLTDADKECIAAATHYVFRLEEQFGLAGLTPLSPYRLSTLAADPDVARQAASFAAVMAFVDGTLDSAKLSAVVKLADALNVHDDFVHDIARLALGDLHEAKANMIRANLESITGRAWATDDMGPWLQPCDAEPDPALVTRFQALERLPDNTFGYAFAEFYRHNSYAYPGAPGALNFEFAVPHDSIHVLAGYDTSPRGELMTSTLTATMHRSHAMSGHVLPVILSWHLGIQLNDVAGAAHGAFDPDEFFYAWARGEDMVADVFTSDWNFWWSAIQPIEAVREIVGLSVPE
jgi:tellurite resistance protein